MRTIHLVNIHSDHPFATPLERRDPVRRLRGRIAAGVTVATAGEGTARTGLTIASIMVIEGEKPLCVLAVGPDADLISTIETSGAFVVHLLGSGHRHLAETFALIRPSPGGLFSAVEHTETPWGPRIAEVPDVVGCRFAELRSTGDQVLVVGEIEHLELSDLTDPLIHFRGSYRSF